jgi:hypothetical protein
MGLIILQLALDTSEILLAGPVGFGPDVTHSFPNMSVCAVSLEGIMEWARGEGYYLTWMISNPFLTSWGRSFTLWGRLISAESGNWKD